MSQSSKPEQAGGSGQQAEIRGQKSEIRGRRTEDRGRRTEERISNCGLRIWEYSEEAAGSRQRAEDRISNCGLRISNLGILRGRACSRQH